MAAAPGAKTMRWRVVAAAMSAPPPASARNCSSEVVATTTMSRGQLAPQNAVTARAASSVWLATRSSSGWVAAPPRLISDTVRPSESVMVLDAAEDVAGVVAGAGAADGVTGLPRSVTATISSTTRRRPSSGRLVPADVVDRGIVHRRHPHRRAVRGRVHHHPVTDVDRRMRRFGVVVDHVSRLYLRHLD